MSLEIKNEFEEINYMTTHEDKCIHGVIKLPNGKPKSILSLGGDNGVIIHVDQKFTRFQKFMWKKFFGIKITDEK